MFQEFCSAFTTPRIGAILFSLIDDQLDKASTLSFEAEATAELRDAARNQVKDYFDTYSKGEVLVEQGQNITEEQLILLRLEHDAAVAELTFGDRARRALGILSLVGVLFALTASYVCRHEQRFTREPQRVAMICGLVVLALAVVRVLSAQTWNAELVPVAIVAMIVAIVYNPSFAMMVTFGLSLLTCMVLGADIAPLLCGDGRDRGRRAHTQRGAHSHQAHQGGSDRGTHLFPHDLGHRLMAISTARPDPQ